MPHTLSKPAVLSITAVGFLVGIGGMPAFAGELTPYSLPSQQRQVEPDMRQQAVPRPSSPTVDESYYRRFAAEARTFSPASAMSSEPVSPAVAMRRWGQGALTRPSTIRA